jgi:uncharacterized protein (UPF0335 family)
MARASNEQFKYTVDKVRYENNELENMLHELRENIQTKENGNKALQELAKENAQQNTNKNSLIDKLELEKRNALETLVSKMTNLAEMSTSNDNLKADIEKLETEKNNLKETIVDIKQTSKDMKHDCCVTKATNTKLEEARRQHLQEFQNMVEVFEETQPKNVQLMSELNRLKAKWNDQEEEVKIVYQTGDDDSQVAENKIGEVADEETFTKFNIVRKETVDEESNPTKDFKDIDLERKDTIEFHMKRSDVGKTEKCPAREKAIKPQYLQNFVSSKTLLKVAESQASDVYQCVKCNQKFKSKLILQKHCKVVHGLFAHFVTIKS